MRWSRYGLILALCSTLLACGGGGGGAAPQEGQPEGALVLKETTVQAQLVLPAGAAWQPEQLVVRNGIGDTAVGPSGAAAVPVWAGGPQYAQACTPDGRVVLLGWLGDGFVELSPRSTAQVLLFMQISGYSMLPEQLRDALDLTANHPAIDDLAAAIEAALAGGATDLVGAPASIRNALDTAVERLLAEPPSQNLIAIDPDPGAPQSGVHVEENGSGIIRIVNGYRRRATAFVRRTAYIPEHGAAEVAVNEAWARHYLGSRNGFSSLVGQAWDFISGQGVFRPATSDPISTPANPPDAVRTTYEVCVVGPGVFAGEHSQNLDEDQKSELSDLWIETAVFDVGIPLVTNVIIPIGGDIVREIIRNENVVRAAGQILNDLARVPAIRQMVDAGDYSGVVREVVKALVEGAAKEVLYNAIENAIRSSGGRFAGLVLEEAFTVLDVFDAVGTGADIMVQGYHIARSNRADKWEIDVLPTRVRLEPRTPRVVVGQEPSSVDFRVTLNEEPPAGQALRYRWSCTSRNGTLLSLDFPAESEVVTDFDSETYQSGPVVLTSSDLVSVEVFYVDGEGTEIVVGADQVMIEVSRNEPRLRPGIDSVRPGEQTGTFEVSFPPGVEVPEQLVYKWSCEQVAGVVEDVPLDEYTTIGTTTYLAAVNATNGDIELLTVDVYAPEDGSLRWLGEASAEIWIEDRPTWIRAAHAPLEATTEDGLTFCAAVIVPVSPPQDAVRMTLHGIGRDPQYYTNGVRTSVVKDGNGQWAWGPVWGPFEPGNYFSLTAACGGEDAGRVGWLMSRFSDFEWRIEIEYGD